MYIMRVAPAGAFVVVVKGESGRPASGVKVMIVARPSEVAGRS
jgi:hypothetical protein